LSILSSPDPQPQTPSKGQKLGITEQLQTYSVPEDVEKRSVDDYTRLLTERRKLMMQKLIAEVVWVN
jgi:hypothetical protein